MKSGAALDTAFVSLESFTPATFKRWVNHRPSNDINRYELASGRIIMTPPASWDHAEIESKLNSILRAFVSKRPLGKVFGSSAGYQLPSGDILEPDASFISRQRWTRGPRPLPGQFLKIVPTLVVEILSPATTQRDRIEKKRIYEANGVDEYWIVDPSAKEITLCHLQSGNYDAVIASKLAKLYVPKRYLVSQKPPAPFSFDISPSGNRTETPRKLNFIRGRTDHGADG